MGFLRPYSFSLQFNKHFEDRNVHVFILTAETAQQKQEFSK